ncbi:MAG: acyltransferase [Flavobacteriales bacterium]|jgi:1-acyl-sn-glycerol-3-phosphate acyltransferase|nr:acyltransferase [Crocinitomicaceae bacterium]NBX80698.1 acyltransferase [Flavobacteriales bacterium]NCA21742.1 acyltransferase [Crocinitomicaceae bacterium]
MKKLVRFIFRIFGWKIDEKGPEVPKAVIVIGPHTSNWDFVIGRLSFILYGLKGRYLVKKELFFPPLGWFLKGIGAIPVDRKQRSNLTEEAAKLFEQNESLYIVFSPEGTRAYNPNWKKGFYYIALKANVPIYICYMDYEKKIGGFHTLFYPTGDVDADILYIKSILKNYKGRFPEKGID